MRLTHLSRFFKADKPSEQTIRVNPRLMAQIESQSERNPAQGFLHIPKTGGSGIGDMLTILEQDGSYCPIKFNHAWRMQDVTRQFPEISVSFVVRDPIERMTSGFMSRLRMGRPRNNSPWTTEEAVSFAFFDNPRDLYLALIGDDEYKRSAALFACRSIQHLKFNYRYYFRSVARIEKRLRNIGVVGSIDRMEDFLPRFARHVGLDSDAVVGNYSMAHVGNTTSSNLLDDGELEAVRAEFSSEYEIYHYLLGLAGK